jgi:hypothetical protein
MRPIGLAAASWLMLGLFLPAASVVAPAPLFGAPVPVALASADLRAVIRQLS